MSGTIVVVGVTALNRKKKNLCFKYYSHFTGVGISNGFQVMIEAKTIK